MSDSAASSLSTPATASAAKDAASADARRWPTSFEETYASPSGFVGWLSVTNYQPIAKRFMVTSLSFFLAGGVLALLMRLQLAVPANDLMSPQLYNELFTMHGSTMMFLFAVPFLEGLALYLLPLMIGSRDVAFPRMTAFSYWTYVCGGLIFYSSFLVGQAPDAGWFSYVPLSGPRYSGMGIDFWLLGLSLVEVAGLTAGVEIVVTILLLRAPGMSINRMPLFVWAMLIVGVMILFAFTTLLMATVLLELDRSVGTRFFDADAGGTPLLWQHLFWFFGHPEVYIIFIPATGIVSAVVTTFARRIVGYPLIVVAIMLTGFVSFGLWVHHMYTTGLPQLSMAFFAAASLMIAIASGTQVFAWIASLWGRRPALRTPLLYVLGFVFVFVLGGLTGVMVAIVPFDWQVHDTYFIVAHFHYVLIGGAVFPIFGGLYYWTPKITGWMLSPRLGQIGFWLAFIGFNITFFPMHIMGFDGMPRRVYTYPEELGLGWMNFLATIGAFMLASGFLLYFADLALSFRRREAAPDNPWGGDSLEWSVSSPPPGYSFLIPPYVRSRHPQWPSDATTDDEPAETRRARQAMMGSPIGWRATLCTDAITARPQSIQYLPGPTLIPLSAALTIVTIAVAVLLKAYILAGAAAVVAAGVLITWFWPDREVLEKLRSSDLSERTGVPVFSAGYRSPLWWGVICTIAIIGTVFATLIYTYFYLWLYSDEWPQGGIERPHWFWPALLFALPLLSIAPQWLGGWCFRRRRLRSAHACFGAATLLMAGFLVGLVMLFLWLPFGPKENAYASAFHVSLWMTTFWAVVVVGFNIALHPTIARESDDQPGFAPVQTQITCLLWYTIAVAAMAVFVTLFVSPYLF